MLFRSSLVWCFFMARIFNYKRCCIFFLCFLFSKKPKGKGGSNAFTVKGYQKWKRVHSGKKCANQVAEIQNLIELNELETGSGANQIGALQRPAETRWSSHFTSVRGLLRLSKTAFLVLKEVASNKGTSPLARGKAPAETRWSSHFASV